MRSLVDKQPTLVFLPGESYGQETGGLQSMWSQSWTWWSHLADKQAVGKRLDSGNKWSSVMGSKQRRESDHSIASFINRNQKVTSMFDIRATKYLKNCCCCCSVTHSCSTPWDTLDCSMPGFPVLHYFLEFTQLISIESVMPANYLILCHQLLLLPSIFPSIRVFSSELVLCMRWPKCWSFSITVLPMNIQGWFPLGLTGLISLLSKGLSKSSPTP